MRVLIESVYIIPTRIHVLWHLKPSYFSPSKGLHGVRWHFYWCGIQLILVKSHYFMCIVLNIYFYFKLLRSKKKTDTYKLKLIRTIVTEIKLIPILLWLGAIVLDNISIKRSSVIYRHHYIYIYTTQYKCII